MGEQSIEKTGGLLFVCVGYTEMHRSQVTSHETLLYDIRSGFRRLIASHVLCYTVTAKEMRGLVRLSDTSSSQDDSNLVFCELD